MRGRQSSSLILIKKSNKAATTCTVEQKHKKTSSLSIAEFYSSKGRLFALNVDLFAVWIIGKYVIIWAIFSY